MRNGLKQHRTTKSEKIEIVKRYLAGNNSTVIAKDYGITPQAITGLLRRRNVPIRPQTENKRKYEIDETFFNKIDSQEKAYFIGFLYADGCNFETKHSVSLCLAEKDEEILSKLNALIQPNRPLKKQRRTLPNKDVTCLFMHNKQISERLAILGCGQRKTFNLLFPKWLSENLIPHFVRGYNDGDGWIGKQNICMVSTESFCNSLSTIFKNKLNINTYIRARHPERKTNTRMLEISGRRQCIKLLDWIYQDASIYLKRKYDRYVELLNFVEGKNKPKICKKNSCALIVHRSGMCRNHYNEQRRENRKVLISSAHGIS